MNYNQKSEAASLSSPDFTGASCLPLSGGIILIEGRCRVSISVSPVGIMTGEIINLSFIKYMGSTKAPKTLIKSDRLRNFSVRFSRAIVTPSEE